MQKITLTVLALLTLSVSAEIYQGTGASGEIIYSDRPSKDSIPLELKGASSYKPPKYRPRTSNNTKKELAPFAYKAIKLVQPANDATLFDSEGPINVTVNMDPALREADKIQLYMDGQPAGQPLHATSFSLTLQDRGSHEILAEVKNSKGKVVGRSKPVKFYYRKHSVLFKKQN